MYGHRWSVPPVRGGTGAAPARRAGGGSAAVAAAFIAAAVAGCASFSPDAGMDVVGDVTAAAIGEDAVKIDGPDAVAAAAGRVRALLARDLSAATAVRIALLNNAGLQAAYNDLGVAEAVRVEASLPPNPTFSLSRISTPAELDIERQIVGDILALAVLPVRARIAADRFRQAQ